MKTFVLTVVAVLGLAFGGSALAADPTTFGGATIDGGVAKLVSDTSVASTPNDDFSGISLPLPAGLTLAQITQLSAEFNVTDDDCAGGSPRFAINYGAGKNMLVYLGPSPSFTGCTKDTWMSSGNLVGTADACRVDTSQLSPGTQCTTWAAALALVGNQPITSISLIVDSSWSPVFTDKEQTVLVRNVRLNGETFLVPKAADREAQPGEALQGAARRRRLAERVQRALERQRDVERLRQVRLVRRQGAERRRDPDADPGRHRLLQGEGPQGRRARRVRRLA